MATRPVNVELHGELREPTDFGDVEFGSALVNVTNVCNLSCTHCFVFRADNPNKPKDKMDDATMLHQLETLRDRHNIKSMLFMGGEPMIRKNLVIQAMPLFERSSIVTNGTYGIPSVPGHLVTVSLDGPEDLNDRIRGEGVFQKVKKAVFERDPADGTIVMLQMTVTAQNAPGIEDFVEMVKDWPVTGLAFTFYVPTQNDDSGLGWPDLRDRDLVIRRVIAVKQKYPKFVKANIGALELMLSERSMEVTGEHGESCSLRRMLPLYPDASPLYGRRWQLRAHVLLLWQRRGLHEVRGIWRFQLRLPPHAGNDAGAPRVAICACASRCPSELPPRWARCSSPALPGAPARARRARG